MKRFTHLSNALVEGAARAARYQGPPASALCMLAQRRTCLSMADRRTKRSGRGADRRRAVNEQR